jgi:hypothetical protein
VSHRLPFPKRPSLVNAKELLFTKYRNWAYEQEIRMWAELKDEEDGLYFYKFNDKLRLVSVIAGARCSVQKNVILETLGNRAKEVEIIKARAGYQRFEIVRNKQGFQ